MTPKEKAIELVNKYQTSQNNLLGVYWDNLSKQCALIAVDELEKQEATLLNYNSESYSSEYWQEVKQEIEKL